MKRFLLKQIGSKSGKDQKEKQHYLVDTLLDTILIV